jgi:hypothetical protein
MECASEPVARLAIAYVRRATCEDCLPNSEGCAARSGLLWAFHGMSMIDSILLAWQSLLMKRTLSVVLSGVAYFVGHPLSNQNHHGDIYQSAGLSDLSAYPPLGQGNFHIFSPHRPLFSEKGRSLDRLACACNWDWTGTPQHFVGKSQRFSIFILCSVSYDLDDRRLLTCLCRALLLLSFYRCFWANPNDKIQLQS